MREKMAHFRQSNSQMTHWLNWIKHTIAHRTPITHAQRMMMYIVQVSITINVLRAIKKCALSTQKYLQMHTHLYTMYSVFINVFVRCTQLFSGVYELCALMHIC